MAVESGLVEFLCERLVGVRQLWVGLAWPGWAVWLWCIPSGYVAFSCVTSCFGSCVTVRLVGVRSVTPCHVVARLVLLSFGN